MLCRRIEHRFPSSDLLRLAHQLSRIAAQTKERAAWIGRPLLTSGLARKIWQKLMIVYAIEGKA